MEKVTQAINNVGFTGEDEVILLDIREFYEMKTSYIPYDSTYAKVGDKYEVTIHAKE